MSYIILPSYSKRLLRWSVKKNRILKVSDIDEFDEKSKIQNLLVRCYWIIYSLHDSQYLRKIYENTHSFFKKFKK
jgi:hypothetical protein